MTHEACILALYNSTERILGLFCTDMSVLLQVFA